MILEAPNVRMLGLGDLARCVELSAEAGWNQNEGDWRFLLQNGHGYGIEMPGQGLVATTVTWDLCAAYTWINMVLVTKVCQGRGYARRLLELSLSEVGSRGQVALLDATDQGAKVYEKLGFQGEKRLVRLKRLSGDVMVRRGDGLPAGWMVRQIGEEDLPDIEKLHCEVVGVGRRLLLNDLLRRCLMSAWILRDPAGRIRGCLMGRGGRTGRQLGPLIAENNRDARVLVRSALSQFSGPVFIDVPQIHLAWLGELAMWGFEPQRRFRRMGQGGHELPTDWARYYAMAGPDFA